MAKVLYDQVGGVVRKVKKKYDGVGGVACKVKKAYDGVAGVAKQYFTALPILQFLTGDASNGNSTNIDVESYQADNGNFILKVKCTNADWSNLRVYSIVNVIDDFVEGDTLTLKWSTGSTGTLYDDKALRIFDESGKRLSIGGGDQVILSTSSSGTYTTTVPKGAYRVQVHLSLGAQGNRNTTWTITELTVGKVTYTVKGD